MTLKDPFNAKDGVFAANIRATTGGDDTELRESLKQFGWSSEFPALTDEHGIVLVGHRRLKIADELGITPVVKTYKFGSGTAADAERLKLALVSNIGFKAMTKEDRQRIAQHLYGELQWTMEKIGNALNVSKATISGDLANCSTTEQSKPAKTASNPKGAGRPKGSGKKSDPVKPRGGPQPQRRRNSPENERRAAALVLDEGLTMTEAAAKTGVGSVQVLKTAVAREQGRREAEPLIDPASLSMTAQQKLDLAIKQAKQKLQVEIEQDVRAKLWRWVTDDLLPMYRRNEKTHSVVIAHRKGIMKRPEYRSILSCLHPDRVQDPELKKRFEHAFNIFTKLEKVLLDEKESPTGPSGLPTTNEELVKRKEEYDAKRAAERAAKRAAKSSANVERR